MTSGDYRQAAQAFQQALAGASGYALQLEIVCQDSSVRDGWARAEGSSNYIALPMNYRGRSCYRILWGTFASSADARAAQATVPEFFRRQMAGKPFPVVKVSRTR